MTERDGIRLLLLADTHVPRRARDLPDAVWAEIERADVVVHAGDWVEADLLDRLEARLADALTGPPVAVAGAASVAVETAPGIDLSPSSEAGTATTPLITAVQYRALMGSIGLRVMATPSTAAAVSVA